VRGTLGQVASGFFSPSRALHQRAPDFKPHRVKFATPLIIPEAQFRVTMAGEGAGFGGARAVCRGAPSPWPSPPMGAREFPARRCC
jgi:hypothetical protein